MIKKFITWIKGLWVSSDISDEERSRIQNEQFLERIKKNAFYERTETNTGVDVLLHAPDLIVTDPTPEFMSPSKKLADEFDQIAWSTLTDDAKRECIKIAKEDFAKQAHILTQIGLV